MKKTQILMIKDKNILNDLYRNHLLKLLNKEFIKVFSFGLFDKKSSLIILILKILNPKVIVVSSNLKSNFFSLFFFWKKGILILNGMGRYRKKNLLRLILLTLFKLNWKKVYIVQSYADYRFLKLYSQNKYYWVPGSGGTEKKIGNKNNFIFIQRDNKILTVYKSICEFLDIAKNIDASIVGCNNKKNLEVLFKGYKVNFINYKKSKDIFLEGKSFVQPSGYGEGFPHSLSDAIVSGLDIYINNKEYLRYGLYILGGKKKKFSKNWSILTNTSQVSKQISSNVITNKYFNIINEYANVN